MIYNFDKKNISIIIDDDEIIDYIILEMHNNEYMIYIETNEGKKISILTDNWEELFNNI